MTRPKVRGLYGMVDTSPRPDRKHLDLAAALLDGGSRVLQLRMKGAPASSQAELLRALLPRCAANGAALIVNDSLELAATFPGLGLHLGQKDVDPREARRILGPIPLIGRSTHNREQALEACKLNVDYIGFGPIFSSESKHLDARDTRPHRQPVGLASLKQVVCDATVSVVAIGGISLDNLPLVLATGVRSIASIAAVVKADNMVEMARALQCSIETAHRDAPTNPEGAHQNPKGHSRVRRS